MQSETREPLSILREVFGHAEFRGLQGEVVNHVTNGGDAVVLFPTGAGKSLVAHLAIAAYEPFKDLRGMLRVASITPKEIRLEISFQLNGRPRLSKEGEGGLITSDPRYLNGIMVAKPGLLNKELVLQVSDIEVPGKTVAKGFLGQMSPYRIAERYAGKEGIGGVMSELTSVELADGAVRFVKTAGITPKDTITNAQLDSASQRLFMFFAVAACLFLVFVAVVIFVGLRLKKGNEGAVLDK